MFRSLAIGFQVVAAIVSVLGAVEARAAASQVPGAEEETVGDEFGTPAARPVSAESDDERSRLERRIRASRITLITSAVIFPVGAAVAAGAAASCIGNTLFGGNCPAAEYAGLGVGSVMFVGGAVGLITGGIMLGVAKKRRRALDRAKLGLRWDARTARLVF